MSGILKYGTIYYVGLADTSSLCCVMKREQLRRRYEASIRLEVLKSDASKSVVRELRSRAVSVHRLSITHLRAAKLAFQKI